MPYSELDKPVTPEIVTVDLPVKGAINSATIRNIGYLLVTAIIGGVSGVLPEIATGLQVLTPDLLDPLVPPVVYGLFTAIAGLFGYRGVSARTTVGDIKGMYKSPNPS